MNDYVKFWNPAPSDLRQMIVNPIIWDQEIPIHADLIFNTPFTRLQPDFTVLEVGCGIGRLMKHIVPQVQSSCGVDISQTMIEESHNYLRGVPNVSTFLVEPEGAYPFVDGTVDLVYSFLCLQHVPGRELLHHIYDEVFRVLKPGGVFRCQTHAGCATDSFAGYVGSWYPSAECLAQDFVGRGFTVCETQTGLGYSEWLWATLCKP